MIEFPDRTIYENKEEYLKDMYSDVYQALIDHDMLDYFDIEGFLENYEDIYYDKETGEITEYFGDDWDIPLF